MMSRRNENMDRETVYQCSDGQYYTDEQIWVRFESGEWSPCCWDIRTGHEWVETRDEKLLSLAPVDETVTVKDRNR